LIAQVEQLRVVIDGWPLRLLLHAALQVLIDLSEATLFVAGDAVEVEVSFCGG